MASVDLVYPQIVALVNAAVDELFRSNLCTLGIFDVSFILAKFAELLEKEGEEEVTRVGNEFVRLIEEIARGEIPQKDMLWEVNETFPIIRTAEKGGHPRNYLRSTLLDIVKLQIED